MTSARVFQNSNDAHTCIRISSGKSVIYITKDLLGLHVCESTTKKFESTWHPLPEKILESTARLYLYSDAAKLPVSEEARTHLQEIIDNGATTTKENTMTASTKPAAVKPAVPNAAAAAAAKPITLPPALTAKPATKAAPPKAAPKAAPKPATKATPPKPATKAPAEVKAVPKAGASKPVAKPIAKVAKAASKPAGKPAPKAKAAVPTKLKGAERKKLASEFFGGRGEKPAEKPAKTAKPAGKKSAADKPSRSPYAGMKLKALTKDTGARAGSLRDKLRAAVLKCTTADEAMGKVITYEGEEYPITGTVLTNMINLDMIKVS